MKSIKIKLLTAAAVIAAMGIIATPAIAGPKKGGAKKAAVADSGTAAAVPDAPPEETSKPSEFKKEALPPINPDDTAFVPSKGKPERGGTGTIEIITRPSGAEIYFADEYRGKSPISVEVPSGRDDLSIDLDGWNLFKSRVNIWNGQKTTLNIELKLPLGEIQVTTNPGKASITLDGRPIGSTQGAALSVRKVPAGKHNLCGSAGSKGGCQAIEVPREDVLKVQLNLK